MENARKYIDASITDFPEVADNPIVLFRGIVGSRAYGTQNANSDMDVRGIFVVPSAEYARLAQPPKQVADERNDRTYYSLVRFCELMSEANPTTIEMLFLPDDCILKTSPAHSMLVDNRGLFVTQKAVDSHLGYALSQIKKARGTNKRVWNPWPEEPPQAEDYCLFLGDAKGPLSARDTRWLSRKCRLHRSSMRLQKRNWNLTSWTRYGKSWRRRNTPLSRIP